MDSRESALLAAKAAGDKKAQDVVVMDLQGLSTLCDYFVLASGNSNTQVEAIAEAVEECLKEIGLRLHHQEGRDGSGWLLLDYGDIVIHIFLVEQRDFYDLERLWGDAPTVEIQ